MPTVKPNDINIYYEVHGDGESLVLIVGLSTDISEWGRFIQAFAREYKVIAFDNRGAGRTDKPDIPYSIDMMADDTAGLLDAIGSGPAHVLGVSLGGRIAVALALRRPDLVRSLILVSTSVKRQDRPSWHGRLVGLAIRFPLSRGSKKYRLPYYAVARQRAAAQSYDAIDRLREIRVPTLILHGKRDGVAPYRVAEEMHAGIAGSKLITFGGGHHFLFIRYKQFVKAVLDFLDSLRTPNPDAS